MEKMLERGTQGHKTTKWGLVIDIYQDEFFSEDQYAHSKRQFEFYDHNMALCFSAGLNAQNKAEESRKRTESFTKIIQGPKEVFISFLQRLTSAVNRTVLHPEVRQILSEFLAFEITKSKSKISTN